jgi:hypothetical protein
VALDQEKDQQKDQEKNMATAEIISMPSSSLPNAATLAPPQSCMIAA